MKKVFALAVAVALVFACVAVSAFALNQNAVESPESPVESPVETPDEPSIETPVDLNKLGDANNDGKVTVADVMEIRKTVAELDANIVLEYADVNQDGKVTVADVMYVRMYVAELIDSFENIGSVVVPTETPDVA